MSHSRAIPGLTPAAAEFLATRRVARLATVDARGKPHIVPICYVFDGAAIALALDEKAKRVPVTELARVRNILANPAVAVLVDDYSEDWSALAYVLVRGQAQLVQPDQPQHAGIVALLRAKYPQYLAMMLDDRPLIRITIERVGAWSARAARDHLR